MSILPSPQLEMENGDEFALMFENGSNQNSQEVVEDDDKEQTSMNRGLRLRPRRQGAQYILDSFSDYNSRMALEGDGENEAFEFSSDTVLPSAPNVWMSKRRRQALTQALVFLGRHVGGHDNNNDGLLKEAAGVLEESVFLPSPESGSTAEL